MNKVSEILEHIIDNHKDMIQTELLRDKPRYIKWLRVYGKYSYKYKN